MVAPSERNYLVISRDREGIYRWISVYDRNYDFFVRDINRRGGEIVAQQIFVSEDELNKITGYKPKIIDRVVSLDDPCEEIGPHYLDELVDRLNSGITLDAQEVLRRLKAEKT
ncbi:hypothetical protein GF386_05175 [Candidatus Pacearchaeota archaeon]|nr:hypothetical protein [Candidatus Pacearchaeota archaeon]MBD3283502.1 hypothetical protein [Candidatus Pacearchaeota archaeon]